MSAIYELKQITKQYGPRTVLAIDALAIDEGETLTLIGPSGAGKSTLLRLLCLLERPTSGTLTFAGQRFDNDVPLAVQRAITLVFQRPMLLDTSVWHNINYGLHLRGQRDDRRIREIIELLGLQQVVRARARTLSGGEMQRVALARALVLRPRVLLLDEPTANLDPHNVALIEAAIAALRHDYGSTIVLATHNLHQAERLSDRTAMILDGEMLEVGPTARVIADPADRRTRAFVNGAMVY